ncbi:hypothetical protein SAMN05892882_1525 [Rhodopseudomonas pentothenatexigens]|uniref:Uncharacterized protein n=1 Tax=Rhodopseudomonas pentothenatexigens TaxID=999699 RepID=A0A336JZK9_9BRAD|nr:hypothetical protein BJ125_1525 [Rhodopseudomonas pentothenatexigens]SSW93739.1 hypothetical protein SAMN05892882_1525 [Rhodopseudomonas pentothenatexigens]
MVTSSASASFRAAVVPPVIPGHARRRVNPETRGEQLTTPVIARAGGRPSIPEPSCRSPAPCNTGSPPARDDVGNKRSQITNGFARHAAYPEIPGLRAPHASRNDGVFWRAARLPALCPTPSHSGARASAREPGISTWATNNVRHRPRRRATQYSRAFVSITSALQYWIPASAGMTSETSGRRSRTLRAARSLFRDSGSACCRTHPGMTVSFGEEGRRPGTRPHPCHSGALAPASEPGISTWATNNVRHRPRRRATQYSRAFVPVTSALQYWIPASAGMTSETSGRTSRTASRGTQPIPRFRVCVLSHGSRNDGVFWRAGSASGRSAEPRVIPGHARRRVNPESRHGQLTTSVIARGGGRPSIPEPSCRSPAPCNTGSPPARG